MLGEITHVCVSKGGVPKLPIAEAWAAPPGLEGDSHRNTRIHGGPRKALLLISEEDLESLRAEGFDVGPGSLGENLTVRGIDFRHLREGMRFRAGGAVIGITTARQPCATLSIYGSIQTVLGTRGGFYAAVLSPGLIRPGDIISLVDAEV